MLTGNECKRSFALPRALMKILFFVLLAGLLTACFRAPHLSTFPLSAPAPSPEKAAGPLAPDREAYAWSGTVAAAGSAHDQTGVPPETAAATTTQPAIRASATAAANPPSVSHRPPPRRLVRQAVRKILAGGRLVSRTQDDPVVPRRSGLALAALLAGIGGLLLFVLGVIVSAGPSGIASPIFLFSFLAGIAAIVAGAVARGQVGRGQAPAADRGRATAGLILGILNVTIFALLILLIIILLLAWGWIL
jgi:hypothetical protein